MLGVIIFGSVRFLSKKITKPKFFFFEKKNRNRVKPTGFGSVFLGQKPVWLGFSSFGSIFSVLARFFPVLARFFSVWLGFSGLTRFFFRFFVGFGSVRFFRFFAYKTKTEPAGFFKNLIGLIGFFSVRFFRLFFFRFSRFNRFSSFFAHPYYMPWKVRLVKLKKEEG
jgi:hypothetical protein